MLTESDIAQIPLAWFVQIRNGQPDFKAGYSDSRLILCHFDRNFGAVGLRKPRLVFQTGRHGTVTDFVGVAEFIEFEQFRRQRFAARLALAFVLVDADFQLSRHGALLLKATRAASASHSPWQRALPADRPVCFL
jgi:hypothetical protein